MQVESQRQAAVVAVRTQAGAEKKGVVAGAALYATSGQPGPFKGFNKRVILRLVFSFLSFKIRVICFHVHWCSAWMHVCVR